MTARWQRAAGAAGLVLVLVLAAAAAAAAERAHQHGVASLQVVLDGNSLTVTLDSPLDNLLGFERGPRTEAERQAVRALAQRLHAETSLMLPSPAAQCQRQAVELVSDTIAPALLAPAKPPSAPAATAPLATALPAAPAIAHADLQATLRFQCAQPQLLKQLALAGLFQAFTRLRQIDAAVVAPGVQRGLKLSPRQPTLAW